jgi:hypothetical protein
MYRILFSLLLGLSVILVSSFPANANADGRKDRDHVRQGKDMGKHDARIVKREGLGTAGQTNRDLRDRSFDRDRGNTANYYGQSSSYYGNYGYPGNSYYGNYGYPGNSYYGAYGYLGNSYYGANGYLGNAYYGANNSYLGNSYYGAYDSNYLPYSSYSTYNYPNYPNAYTYGYPGYDTYYYNPGMYNPNTVFVNPPSSLNYATGYPLYSENYIY